jgi:predicted nucleotidyltransferase
VPPLSNQGIVAFRVGGARRDGPDSDIDLLVEFLPEANVSLLRHFAAERELSGLLRREVDLVSKHALREPLRREIITQSRLLYEGSQASD